MKRPSQSIFVSRWIGSAVGRLHRFDLQPFARSRWQSHPIKGCFQSAERYGTAILPVWLSKPRDKAKVERAAIVGRRLLGRLRHRRLRMLRGLGQVDPLIRRLGGWAVRRRAPSRRPGSPRRWPWQSFYNRHQSALCGPVVCAQWTFDLCRRRARSPSPPCPSARPYRQ